MNLTTLENMYERMESTTMMNRGEVEPSFEGILIELRIHFSIRKIKKAMPLLRKYYRYMVLREWLDFQQWREERYGTN